MNLAQIRSAALEIFHTQTKSHSAKNRTLRNSLRAVKTELIRPLAAREVRTQPLGVVIEEVSTILAARKLFRIWRIVSPLRSAENLEEIHQGVKPRNSVTP